MESVPQLILKSYVILRSAESAGIVTLASIVISFVTLATKIISDDNNMMVDTANDKTHYHFFVRFFFRIAEIRYSLFFVSLSVCVCVCV